MVSTALSAGNKKVEGFDADLGVFLFGVNMLSLCLTVLWIFIMLVKHIGFSKLAVASCECFFV